MAVVTKQVLIEAPLERFYEIVVDYEKYPEFVPGIRRCRVRDGKGEKQVEYELDLGIRRIKYVLRHEEQRPRRVAWSLVSGDMMKVSNGSWELSADDGRTRATYSVEIRDLPPTARPPGPRRSGQRRADPYPAAEDARRLQGAGGAEGLGPGRPLHPSPDGTVRVAGATPTASGGCGVGRRRQPPRRRGAP